MRAATAGCSNNSLEWPSRPARIRVTHDLAVLQPSYSPTPLGWPSPAAGSPTGFNTVGDDFATGASILRPMPSAAFEPGLLLTPRVDTHARVTVRQCRYSAPARLIGRRVRVLLRER